MKSTLLLRAAILAALASLGTQAQAQLFSDNFDINSGNWQFNSHLLGNSADAFFDYSTVGVPPAPGGTTTRGLMVTANVGAANFSGGSASPIGLSLPAEYTLSAHVWQNSLGAFPAGGSGSTQLTTMTVGVSGSANEFAGSTITGVQFAVTAEGGSGSDWRAYSALMPNGAGATLSVANTPTVYAAGSLNNSASFYGTLFPGQTPPAAQTGLYASQTGTTAAGTPGFAWNLWEITKTSASITWKVNGTEIASVDASLFPSVFGGNNIALGQADINATSSSSANAGVLIFGLFDNVTVTAVPEPEEYAAVASSALIGFALWRRSRRA